MNSSDSSTYKNLHKRTCVFLLIVSLFVGKLFAVISVKDTFIISSKKYIVGSITTSGNKKTKERIILRELTFKINDSISIKELYQQIARSEQNLLNTSLFNFSKITFSSSIKGDTLFFDVNVTERWYLWPNPEFEIQDRNFNTWWETKDLYRINYGLFLTAYNVRGRNETAVLKFRKGYTELIGFGYKIPYLNKKQTLGANFSIAQLRNNEVAFSTQNNKLVFIRDYKNYLKSDLECKLGFTYRKGIYTRHIIDLIYTKKQINDSILKLNPDYFGNEHQNAEYISLQYRFKYDERDSKIFPLKGIYYELYLCKDGLNILKNENTDNLSVDGIVKKYWQPFKRFSIGSSVRVRFRQLNSKGYFFNQALGYSDFIRGYEYYVIDGQTFSIFKTNFNYQLVSPKVVQIPFKKLNQFTKIPYAIYLSAHADAGFVQDRIFYTTNNLTNKPIYGIGAGISLVTYYDFVLRFDYSMNHLKEHGCFVHFTAPF